MTDIRLRQIRIQKRALPEWLTYYIFVFPFAAVFLIEFFNIPSFIKYSIDVAYIVALLCLVIRKQAFISAKVMPFVIFTISFFLYVLIVYLFNFQSVFYFLWGFRNNFRFYIAFILYVVFFEKEDLHKCLKFTDALFWINAVVTLFQFFVLNYRQDYLGGIFGTEKGCNAYTIIFFGVVISKSILSFMNRQEKVWMTFLKCGISLVVAAMAELKVYFILFPFMMIVAAFITHFSWRKFLLLFASSIMLMFAGLLLATIFKDEGILSFERIFEMITASNYATAKDLGRFTAIPTISNDFLTSVPKKLFGLGLGNCETSAFAICNTPFFQTYSYLHYIWFSSAFLLLETGYIGLLAAVSFLVLCFVLARRQMKTGKANELFCQISMMVSIICIIMVFYNSTLRTETAYLAFFALALPFVSFGEEPVDAKKSMLEQNIKTS